MSNSRRRSIRSAKAPEGTARSTTGKLPAVSINATKSADVVSEVINHASPTSSIKPPTFEATAAIHSARKSGSRKGAHADAKLCHRPVNLRFLLEFDGDRCCSLEIIPLNRAQDKLRASQVLVKRSKSALTCTWYKPRNAHEHAS